VTCNWKYISKLSVATEAEGLQIFASRGGSFIHRSELCWGRTISFQEPSLTCGLLSLKDQTEENTISSE